jgi:hypothetical protein
MADRVPPEDTITQGWHARKWGPEVDLFCCNFCAYDSGMLSDVLEHIVVRHWVPFRAGTKLPEDIAPAPLPSKEEQIASADSTLESALAALLDKGALSMEDLGIG